MTDMHSNNPARVSEAKPTRVKHYGSVSGLEPEGRGLTPRTLTITEFASLGGRARWKGTTKKQRSEAMKKIRSRGKKVIHKQVLDEQAQGK